MLKKAIVKRPGPNISEAITDREDGVPDPDLIKAQHIEYVELLRKCGLKVTQLDTDTLPDSTFVEDTAICLKNGAILASPGAASRRTEVIPVLHALEEEFDKIYRVKGKGTLDGGDVLEVDGYYYVGITTRTNKKGAKQFLKYAKKLGHDGEAVKVPDLLHLKSGITYLGDGRVLIARQFRGIDAFQKYKRVKIKHVEDWFAANMLPVNGKLIAPAGYPRVMEKLDKYNYNIIEIDISEFEKLNGGVSCLSLRY